MAIVIPAGSHPDADQREVSFVELMTDQKHLLDPPQEARADAGARVDNLVRLLDAAVAAYRRAVQSEHGPSHADARVSLNVKNSFRREAPSLATLLGLH